MVVRELEKGNCCIWERKRAFVLYSAGFEIPMIDNELTKFLLLDGSGWIKSLDPGF